MVLFQIPNPNSIFLSRNFIKVRIKNEEKGEKGEKQEKGEEGKKGRY